MRPPAPAAGSPRQIALASIDREDRRFQYRVNASAADLESSLRDLGQRVPVVLWGRATPFKIIDGFRRIDALSELGAATVTAVLRTDIDEDHAFALSFSENVKQRTFSALDKANAIWISMKNRRLPANRVAEAFDLSGQQVYGYLSLLDAESTPLDARPLLALDDKGFHLGAMHFQRALSSRAKSDMLEVLERAAALIRRDLRCERAPASAQQAVVWRLTRGRANQSTG